MLPVSLLVPIPGALAIACSAAGAWLLGTA